MYRKNKFVFYLLESLLCEIQYVGMSKTRIIFYQTTTERM